MNVLSREKFGHLFVYLGRVFFRSLSGFRAEHPCFSKADLAGPM
jgi:hypothetical protein